MLSARAAHAQLAPAQPAPPPESAPPPGSAPPGSDPAAPPAPPPLQAGGLQAPPPDATSYPVNSLPPTPTEQQLDDSSRHDSGRGLEFVYFDVEGGVQQVGLRTLHTSNLVPETVPTSDTGSMFGVGAGLRLVVLTIGPRFRIGHFSDWDLWSLDGELGIHLPLGDVEPHFTLGAGYSKLGNASATGLTSDSQVRIRGYNVRVGFGIDYYVTHIFSIGANLTGEVLGLTRPGVDPTQLPQVSQTDASACANQPTPEQQQACVQGELKKVYSVDGSSLGLSGSLSVVLGLHF